MQFLDGLRDWSWSIVLTDPEEKGTPLITDILFVILVFRAPYIDTALTNMLSDAWWAGAVAGVPYIAVLKPMARLKPLLKGGKIAIKAFKAVKRAPVLLKHVLHSKWMLYIKALFNFVEHRHRLQKLSWHALRKVGFFSLMRSFIVSRLVHLIKQVSLALRLQHTMKPFDIAEHVLDLVKNYVLQGLRQDLAQYHLWYLFFSVFMGEAYILLCLYS